MKYRQEAEQLKEAVGKEANIVSLTHCVTRLRMELKDASVCNTEAIESIHGVKGVVMDGNQLQVVIGSEVNAFYLPSQQNTPTSTGGEMNAGFCFTFYRKSRNVYSCLL